MGLEDPQTVEVTEHQWLGAFSPVEPISYGVAYSGSILAYNLYSGTLTREITDLGTRLGKIALSADGRIAYVDDEEETVVKAVDLVSGAILQTFPYEKPPFHYGAGLFTFRLRGREFLMVAGDGPASVYDVPSGELLTTVADLTSFTTAQSPDFLELYVLEYDGQLLRRVRFDYSEVDGVLSFTPTQDFIEHSFRMNAPVVSHDGSRVFVGRRDGFPLMERNLQTDLTKTPELHCCVRMVQTMTNGLWAANVDEFDELDTTLGPDVYFFTPDGEVLDSWYSRFGEARLIGVSSDATRVVTKLRRNGTVRTFSRNTPVAP